MPKPYLKSLYEMFLLTTYQPRVRSLQENLRLRPCRVDCQSDSEVNMAR